jgi:hypothetical protein
MIPLMASPEVLKPFPMLEWKPIPIHILPDPPAVHRVPLRLPPPLVPNKTATPQDDRLKIQLQLLQAQQEQQAAALERLARLARQQR